MKKIAILGSTGYIGRSLVLEFLKEKDKFELFLFYRNKSKIKKLVKESDCKNKCNFYDVDEFNSFNYDVIINSTGISDPFILKENPQDIFEVTEKFDNLIINYLNKKPKTLCINFSSGAVYGNNFQKSITFDSKSILNINNLEHAEYYSIAKINSEAKHRTLKNLNIVDLRIFSFFSRFLDVESGFLMSEIINCIKNKKKFITNNLDIVRDYIIAEDLFALIKIIIEKEKINDFFDVYSKKQISKLKLLSVLKEKYNFEYVIKNEIDIKNKNSRNIYYSKNKKAEILGYKPKYSSIEGILKEMNLIDLSHKK